MTAHTDHPSRHFDRTCPACVVDKSEIRELVERLRDEGRLWTGSLRGELAKEAADALTSAEEGRREAERSEAAIRDLMNCYNVGGWTDAEAAMRRAHSAESQISALRARVEVAEKVVGELVRLKDLKKRTQQMTWGQIPFAEGELRCLLDEYERYQPLAWQAARALLGDKQ